MIDSSTLPPPSGGVPTSAAEDKVLPIAIYVLYLLGFVTLITPVVGLIIAYVGLREPVSWRTPHYTFAIWTFWLATAAMFVSTVLIAIGIPMLALLLLGLIPIIVGGTAMLVVTVWFAVRCVLGLVYAAKGDAYPRPRNLLV